MITNIINRFTEIGGIYINPELLSLLESILFVYTEPLKLDAIAEILEIKEDDAESLLIHYQHMLEASKERGLILRAVAGGYQLVTKPTARKYIEKFYEPKYRYPLSQAALETLAIILYKSPVTRPEIDKIRGVNSDAALRTLLDRGLIRESGCLQAPGKPILYSPTNECLKYLGINSTDDLPNINAFFNSKNI